ncbi:MAG TPA: energy transducer TonB, partial [Gammaproteobacteria bacterium]|nr:energy transducer TonB [Gammaproteobacteria bacterium]
VAAERATAQGLMGLLSERKVHRLLIKPPALGITRLLLDSAVNRCVRLADVPANAVPLPVAEQPRPPGARHEAAAVPFWMFATAGAALLTGVVVIASVSAGWRSADDVPLAASAPSRAVTLEGAAAAREDVGVDPRDNTELVVVAAASAEPAAHEQADAVVAASYADAEAALLANDYAAARTALAAVRRADPASSRLAFLEAQLERAQRAAVAPRAEMQPARAAGASTELDSLLTLARASIQRGELLEPRGGSARDYVGRASRLAPQDGTVAAVRTELAASLLTAAHRALTAGDVSQTSSLVGEARRFGADAKDLTRLESDATRQLAERAARQSSGWLALADARVRQGALLEPVDDSARHYLTLLRDEAAQEEGLAPVWAAFSAALEQRITAALVAHDWSAAEDGLAALTDAPNAAAAAESLRTQLAAAKLAEHYLAVVAPASELELKERAAPVYPLDAARDGVEGWVDVEFIVDETGRPRDFEVVAAEPQGQFEEAALAALAKYRYEPFAVDGRLFARRVGLRIRFTLE